MAKESKRYALVTGANRGLGFGVCELLASQGIVVILTARDEKRGLEAVQKLKDIGLSDYVVFHQLDVSDSHSITALSTFIATQFGKLDILVNNAAVFGYEIDRHSFRASDSGKYASETNFAEVITETYELAEECLTINYYGVKKLTEALIDLLQLSNSPRIVNISSIAGKLEVQHEWAKEVLSDDEKLSEEKIDEVLNQYLQDFRECLLKTKRWPTMLSAYSLSKAALNAYTRIQAKKFQNFRINCVCPGGVKTDSTFGMGELTIKEGAESPVALVLLPNDGPSGCFFNRKEKTLF
ncbi:NAD(P)-binding Rossmann-fold superfamily protein [Euphorbia peplus]|nr:NAD(P)-binding Rossmann-fold superfamily protein [Euphorbia peplus]